MINRNYYLNFIENMNSYPVHDGSVSNQHFANYQMPPPPQHQPQTQPPIVNIELTPNCF